MAAVAIPTFTYGTYRSIDGSSVTFTDDLLRQLERNTNFVIKSGVFKPAVGYDHPVYPGAGKKNTDAHGTIVGATFRNGVLHCDVDQPSVQFAEDVKAGRRLHVSGEFDPNFEYPDEKGNAIKVGPTIVGLAAIGRFRPAVKNPKIVPLSELSFSDTISAAESFFAREELKKSGFVAHTFDGDGVFAFSEITVDPAAFGGTAEQETRMDSKDLDQITAIVGAAIKPLAEKQEKIDAQIVQLSEAGQRKGDAKQFCEALREDKKPLGKVSMGQLEDLLADPTIPEPARVKVKAFANGLSAVVAPGGVAADDKKKDDTTLANEPAKIALLRPLHFSDPDKYGDQIAAGIDTYAIWQPDKMKDAKTFEQQVAVVKKHVDAREASIA